MNKINYQKILDKILENIKKDNVRPKLLVHSCCAPCSSYVLEYLNDYFYITVLYYNPNISPKEEYEKRKAEQIRFIHERFSDNNTNNKVSFMDCDYESEKYAEIVKGLEKEPEGGMRCVECFSLRLDKTAELAKLYGFDYFVTTLSISPLKNAQLINRIGSEISEKYGVSYLPSDFKKREGYKRSIELSKKYGLYRQNFCGCVYSKIQAESSRG
ncbi:MAG: epoxyqueuosine reductase QueH [Clostridia bacterium]|nr:epoxyqueuosine reductase QueH [Clostridia bacterium]